MAKRLIVNTLSIAMLLAFLVGGGLVLAGAVTQGFKTNVAIPTGSVVSLASNSSDQIEKSTFDNEARLIGVAASANDALIDLQPVGSLIRVAVSGDTTLLVTNLNGDISPGDQLVISPLSGIATKLNNDYPTKKIIATAGGSFSASTTNTITVEATTATGQKKTATVGRINAKLMLSDRSDQKAASQNILATVGEKLTGKPTNPVRLVASSVIAVSTFALAGLILNGSVKGSFISLGRNPLSKDSIVGGLFRASLLAVIITAMGLAMAYVVLLV